MSDLKKKIKSRKGLSKSFQCDFSGCDKAFTRLEHLERHQLNHSPKQIYGCPIPRCTKTFVRKDLYKRHIERHQKQNNQPLHDLEPIITTPGVDGTLPPDVNLPQVTMAAAAAAAAAASDQTNVGRPQPMGSQGGHVVGMGHHHQAQPTQQAHQQQQNHQQSHQQQSAAAAAAAAAAGQPLAWGAPAGWMQNPMSHGAMPNHHHHNGGQPLHHSVVTGGQIQHHMQGMSPSGGGGQQMPNGANQGNLAPGQGAGMPGGPPAPAGGVQDSPAPINESNIDPVMKAEAEDESLAPTDLADWLLNSGLTAGNWGIQQTKQRSTELVGGVTVEQIKAMGPLAIAPVDLRALGSAVGVTTSPSTTTRINISPPPQFSYTMHSMEEIRAEMLKETPQPQADAEFTPAISSSCDELTSVVEPDQKYLNHAILAIIQLRLLTILAGSVCPWMLEVMAAARINGILARPVETILPREIVVG